jgi:hypothetical protein
VQLLTKLSPPSLPPRGHGRVFPRAHSLTMSTPSPEATTAAAEKRTVASPSTPKPPKAAKAETHGLIEILETPSPPPTQADGGAVPGGPTQADGGAVPGGPKKPPKPLSVCWQQTPAAKAAVVVAAAAVAEAKADASRACWRHCATALQLPHRPRLPERSPRRLAAAAAAATAAKAQAVGAFWSA